MHLERLRDWLRQQPNLAVLYVSYNDLVEQPAEQSRRVCEFLAGKVIVERMVKAVDPSLYRNRKTAASPVAGN